MANFLAQIVQVKIQAGPAWTSNIAACSNAVVCWLWCLEHTAYIGGTPASGANPNASRANGTSAGHPGNFLEFLQNGPGGLKKTDHFIARMAAQVGTRQRILTALSLRKGMLVVWRDGKTRAFRHVAVNGGNNTLYGYNQGGGYYKPQCTHAQHRWCARRAEHLSTAGYMTWTVTAEQAMRFFLKHHDSPAMW